MGGWLEQGEPYQVPSEGFQGRRTIPWLMGGPQGCLKRHKKVKVRLGLTFHHLNYSIHIALKCKSTNSATKHVVLLICIKYLYFISVSIWIVSMFCVHFNVLICDFKFRHVAFSWCAWCCQSACVSPCVCLWLNICTTCTGRPMCNSDIVFLAFLSLYTTTMNLE